LGAVGLDKVVLIGAQADYAGLADAYGVADVDVLIRDTLKVKALKLLKPNAQAQLVNAMPLVFARAVASIVDESAAAVKKAMRNMVRFYNEKGIISAEDTVVLNDLMLQVVSIPLVNINDEILQAQAMYDDTMKRL
jgi:hypothetical protein